MSASIIFSLSLCSVFLFPLMNQPLTLGLSIMFSTMLFCLLAAMFLSSWYGYILFLIYVGGLLVMFAYVAALSPNTLFGGASSLMFFLSVQIFLPITLSFSFFPDLSNLSVTTGCLGPMKTIKTYGIELVSPSMISILVGLGLTLLVNLIVVVKICYYQHTTLRPYKTIYANSNSKSSSYFKSD
uniref:NADH-ubiquinone oxidoreductase chain 6 n=1 Tax=Tylomelania sarasinorum TaxID=232253 RepID=A0A2Z1Q2X1_9CAEN|nr:NADH dehydrogenase subunit 6 [Tylomelania sarasinorum]AND97134.1 NADH dehydrogenase subunit 6 [Tylomelania sarasinorum]